MFDLPSLITGLGYFGVFAIVFAESGILIGIFLPGDSLLFTAGFLASQGYFNIVTLASLTGLAALLGDSAGYALGHRVGKKIFNKDNSLFFDKSYIRHTEEFYKKHGPKTIFLARFLPVVRTLAPIMAGVGGMHYKTFLSYNVLGALIWGTGITVLGYVLGSRVPNIDKYIYPIVACIILATVIPPLLHLLRHPDIRAKMIAFFKGKR